MLLNARLYPNMRVNQQASRANAVMMVLPVADPANGSAPGQKLTLFRLPSVEKGDEFARLCRDNAPK